MANGPGSSVSQPSPIGVRHSGRRRRGAYRRGVVNRASPRGDAGDLLLVLFLFAVGEGVPQLLQQSFVVVLVPSGRGLGLFLGQFIQQMLLPGIQFRGMITLTSTSRSPRRWPLGYGTPSPFNRITSPGWVPGGITSSWGFQGGDGQAGPQGRLDKGNRHLQVQVVALPLEKIVGPDMHDDV